MWPVFWLPLVSRLDSYKGICFERDVSKRWNERIIIWFRICINLFGSNQLPLPWDVFFLSSFEEGPQNEGGGPTMVWFSHASHRYESELRFLPTCFFGTIHMYLYDCGTYVCTTNNKWRSLWLKSYLVSRCFCCLFPFSWVPTHHPLPTQSVQIFFLFSFHFSWWHLT